MDSHNEGFGGPQCSSVGPRESSNCVSPTALHVPCLEAPAPCSEELRENPERPQCLPLLKLLSGLDWAGGRNRFIAWQSPCEALRGLFRGPWRAAETTEFVGAEAELPRQATSCCRTRGPRLSSFPCKGPPFIADSGIPLEPID